MSSSSDMGETSVGAGECAQLFYNLCAEIPERTQTIATFVQSTPTKACGRSGFVPYFNHDKNH